MNPANDDRTAMSREEIAGLWCARLATSLDHEDRAAFEAWLDQDPANGVAYDKALSVWHGLHAIGDTPELIGHRADALDALRQANRRRWSRGWTMPWGKISAIAASLLLVALVSTWYLMRPEPIHFATTLGERRTAMLDDGSRLSLDAETRLAVDYDEDRREITLLAGRAKFDVAHDPSRPFTVAAGGQTVVATGTSFSVELLRGRLHVIVYEGHVRVAGATLDDAHARRIAARRPDPGATPLAPGRELVAALDQPIAPVVRADVARSLAWEGGQLDFVDEPLASAVERLNRYSRDQVSVGDGRAAAIPINGVFNAGDTDAFLEALAQAYPVQVRREGSSPVIRSIRR